MAAQFATESGDNPLWHYVLDLYGRPGVKEQMLTLQNDYGVDVLLVLSDHWLRSQSKSWPEEDALAAYIAWRDALVLPLRALRVSLEKPSEPLRSQLLKSELLAEQEGIRRLFAVLERAQGERELLTLDALWAYPQRGQKKEAVRPLLQQFRAL
ncbi:TIGR02444 family protein [Thalassolituus sp. LLYu03]|uniref:TIGR02444 family protein n=1 Tax=Thalassolituus sp. LLYu03 TaxID=3421656 RepID=UPI003D29691C